MVDCPSTLPNFSTLKKDAILDSYHLILWDSVSLSECGSTECMFGDVMNHVEMGAILDV